MLQEKRAFRMTNVSCECNPMLILYSDVVISMTMQFPHSGDLLHIGCTIMNRVFFLTLPVTPQNVVN